MTVRKLAVCGFLLAGQISLALTACRGGDGGVEDAAGLDSGGTIDSGGATDGGGADGGLSDADPDDDGGSGAVIDESEPNDGTTVDEVNELAVDTRLHGIIGDAEDADIFSVPTLGGHAYRARLTTSAGSPLEGHLTVIDAGRGGEAAGADFAHLSRTGMGGVEVEWVAMDAGHLVAVRDARAVGGTGMGGADYAYELVIEELDLATYATALELPSTTTGDLAHAGAMDVRRFAGTEGTDVIFDLTSTGDGMNARLFIVAESTGDWIARNDDRGASDVDPLLDAPLTAGGTLFLVIDNIEESATALGYSLDASLP